MRRAVRRAVRAIGAQVAADLRREVARTGIPRAPVLAHRDRWPLADEIERLERELGIGLAPCPTCDGVVHRYEIHHGIPVVIAWPCCHAFEWDDYPDWGGPRVRP